MRGELALPDENFGVPPLDELLGGFPRGSLILLENEPGVEAEPFLYQSVHNHLQAGEEVVYAVANRAPKTVLASMRESGFDAERYQARLFFLDAFSALFGMRENAAYTLDDPKAIDALSALLERVATEHPRAMLVLDPVSTFIDHVTLPQFLKSYPRLQGAMRKFRFCTALLTRWPYGESLAPLVDPFDGLVMLRGVQDRVLFGQYFEVHRSPKPAAPGPRRSRLYRALKPGGIHVYIPKILVTGPHHAGKTSFIHAASDQAASAEHGGTTVGIDHGHVSFEGLTADLFGTPGQERFDPLIKTIAHDALGVIVMVDSVRPETFPRAQDMLRMTRTEGLPALVAATKQDLPGALPPNRIAQELDKDGKLRVIPCDARDRASTRHVLQELVQQILQGTVVP